MADLSEKLKSAVHLCVDMQRLFAEEGPWPTPWMEVVLPKAIRLVEVAPARTVFTRFVPPTQADEPQGMWGAYWRKWSHVRRGEIVDALVNLVPALARFAPPATIFNKFVYSAFADGQLHPFLRGRDVDTVILTGSETDVCVLSSALSAVDLGYRVVIARDAVCSSSDETHDALMSLYRRRFDLQIVLADVEEIVDAWAAHVR